MRVSPLRNSPPVCACLGQDIPLFARIISVADTYDAMTSDRAYRKALPHQVAMNEIHECQATQFDPDVSGNFLEAIAQDRRERTERGDPVPD